LIAGRDHFSWELSRFPNWNAGELEAGSEDGREEEASGFETDNAGDFREIMCGFDVCCQVRDYGLCRRRVTKDRKYVREELILVLLIMERF
jgi:hypothetical protein